MSDVVLFPDATAIIASYLAEQLADRGDDTAVVPRVPHPRPVRLVLVRRTGGTSRGVVIDDAQITLESWDETDETAHDRIQLCRGILLASDGAVHQDVVIYRTAEISGPGNLPDPLSNSPRYSQTLLVALRGATEPAGS